MLGKPGSISLLSGSIVGPVEDRQIYRRKGLEWGITVEHERQHILSIALMMVYLHQTRVFICWMAKVITAVMSIVSKRW